MADVGHLVPPSQDPSRENIWTETKKRLDRTLPDLFNEIFPDAPKESEKPPASAPASPLPPTPATEPEPEPAAPADPSTTDDTPNGKENQAVVSEEPKSTDEKAESV